MYLKYKILKQCQDFYAYLFTISEIKELINFTDHSLFFDLFLISLSNIKINSKDMWEYNKI